MKINHKMPVELYEAPKAEVLCLECEDVVSASGTVNTDPWTGGNSNWCD